MKIRDVIPKHKPVVIRADTTYQEAVEILYDNHISGAPVVDKNGKMIGLVSEKDLFRAVHPSYKRFYKHPEKYLDFENREKKMKDLKDTKVTDYMIKKVVTACLDDPLLKIGALMLARGIHRIPIVENGGLIGVVTRRRIYGNVLRHQLGLDK